MDMTAGLFLCSAMAGQLLADGAGQKLLSLGGAEHVQHGGPEGVLEGPAGEEGIEEGALLLAAPGRGSGGVGAEGGAVAAAAAGESRCIL